MIMGRNWDGRRGRVLEWGLVQDGTLGRGIRSHDHRKGHPSMIYTRVTIVAEVAIEDVEKLRAGVRSAWASIGGEVDEGDLTQEAGYGLPLIVNDLELFGAGDQQDGIDRHRAAGLEVLSWSAEVEETPKPFVALPVDPLG